MAVQTLQITLTANNQQALAALQQTVTSLNGVSAAAANTGGATGRLGTNFTGLSRIIQDLPYGFNAIANNLTNILPAAGALGLGISVLVAGLQFAQIGFVNWTRGLGGTNKATEDANKLTDKYIDNLAKERSELDTLYQTAVNLNVPMAARNASVEKLQKLYPSILSNIDAETIKAGLAADAYMRIVDALDKKAMATAAEDLKVDKYKELFKIQEEIKKVNDKYGITSTKVIKDNNKGYQELTTSAGGASDAIDLVASSSDKANLKNQQYRNELNELQKQAFATQQAIDQLNGIIVQNQTVTTTGGEVTDKQINDYVRLQKELEYYNRLLVEQSAITKLRANMAGKDTATVSTGGINLPQQKDLTNLQLTINSNNTLNKVLAEQAMALNMVKLKKDEAFAADTANYLTQSITNMFNAMINGQSIGTALGDMFKRLAVDIAMASAKAAIFQGIMSVLTAPLSTGAKAGQAVAGAMGFAGGGGGKKGGGFLSLLGKLLGFSEGGTVSGPRSGYPVMLHGTEHIVRPDQMRSIIASASQMGGGNSRVVVEGRISGNDIFISQKRTSTFRALTT
jgi:hypothetical protein